MFSRLFWNSFGWINEKLLCNTKDNTTIKGDIVSILKANAMHTIRTALNCDLKLQYPNDIVKFPLPNRWSSHDPSYSKQQLYMVIKQVTLIRKPAGEVQREEIKGDCENKKVDVARSNIDVMEFLSTVHLGEI